MFHSPFLTSIEDSRNHNNTEDNRYIYHSDHLGSSAFLTYIDGNPTQHLQYLPFGEPFIDQRTDDGYAAPYTFSAKERDPETGYSYFGARYYSSDISVWLSVDPMADKSPEWSPYRYGFNNPVRFIDPDGMFETEEDAKNWAKSKGIKTGFLRNHKIVQGKDGTWSIANKKKGYSYTKAPEYDDKNVSFVADQGNSVIMQGLITAKKGSSRNIAQKINTVATMLGLATNATKQIVKIPNVGYNIAYNSTLLKGVNYLKPIGYWATGASFVSDIYLTSTGQQSLGETVTNTAVTGVSIGVGGWPGLIIQANYQASKAYMKTLMKHPDWAPYPVRGFNH